MPGAAAGPAGAARALRPPVRGDHGRRAAGHQRGAARADRADRAGKPVHGRRRAAVDLRLSARGRRAVRAAGGAARADGGAPHAAQELPLAAGDPGGAGSRVRVGERVVALEPGREPAGAPEPLVELLVADKGADYAAEGIASPWRVAEARALAARVEELVMGGARAGQIVVLTRASTDLRAYERALEDRGIPTYVIGGRGYWAHPQVVDLVAYLRALANPRDA